MEGKGKEPANPKKRERADSQHNPATEEKMSGTSEGEGTDKLRDGCKVYIGGIPNGVTAEEELTQELKKVGDLWDLRIVRSKGKSKNSAIVHFKNKAFSPKDIEQLNKITLEGNKITACYPEERTRLQTVEREPDVVFIIGDKEKLTSSIEELRQVLADHPDPEDVLDGYTGEEPLDTGKHPLLARPGPSLQPPRWIHVQLQVVDCEETSSTTLALRDDKCYGAGFMNRNGVWYDLGQDLREWHGIDKQLPPEYNSVCLDWGYHLWSDVADYELISEKLGSSIYLGKESATAAVRTLSRYPDVEEDDKPMLALTVLMIMVCESARFNHIFRSIDAGWDTEMELTHQQYEYTRSWREISLALLRWKDHGHNSKRWPQEQHSLMGIKYPVDALRVVCLLFNNDQRTKQMDLKYTIEEDKEGGFNAFIKELRGVLAHHDHQEGILDGHPDPEYVSALNKPAMLAKQCINRWPARLINIKLQVQQLSGKETSTTLAVRDNNAHLLGFMNQQGVWYDLKEEQSRFKDNELPPEFNSEPLNWGSYKDILGISERGVEDSSWGLMEEEDVDVSAWDEVREKLGTENLGKDFAINAVRTLSRYPHVEKGDCPKLALAGLIIIFCESARLDPVHKHIQHFWDWEDDIQHRGFPNQLMEYVQKSDLVSQALVLWKASRWSRSFLPSTELRGMGILIPEDALKLVHLVRNC
ncbi:hypothetical protein ZWY2020_059377 [Hordeum vulgare]|nr:hypothetical protein ZWY2020_059377 [Hordeum vulgare]